MSRLSPTALLTVLGVLLCVACGDEVPSRATLVQPIFENPCQVVSCGEHGQCSELGDGSPFCNCAPGYVGAECEACETGYHRDALSRCAPDRTCAEQTVNPCAPYGACNDEDGVIACRCDPGYEGPRCTLCQPGFGRNEAGECLQLVLGPDNPPDPDPVVLCTVDACNGNGQCDEVEGKVECTCDAGYAGSRCGACSVGYRRDLADRCVKLEVCEPETCGEHGTCEEVAGQVSCSCEVGYGLPRCSTCAPGYHSEDGGCVIDSQCLANTCGGRGTCMEAVSGPTCSCVMGYSGLRCEACATGYHRNSAFACVVDEVCAADSCGAHGDCRTAEGEIACACDAGYAGPTCAACATGFHRNMAGLCVLDQTCQPKSCADTATCNDESGEIECLCKTGYAGPECEACAAGYVRDFAKGICVPLSCQDNPIKTAGAIDFESIAGFPTSDNSCTSGVAAGTQDVQLSSIGGNGTVWVCAKNTVYSMPTAHVFVEAGSDYPAALTFRGAVASLSFDYAARSELALELLADGAKVRDLSATRRSFGSLSLSFDPPITKLSFRSKNGSTQLLALDNLAYAPPVCR